MKEVIETKIKEIIFEKDKEIIDPNTREIIVRAKLHSALLPPGSQCWLADKETRKYNAHKRNHWSSDKYFMEEIEKNVEALVISKEMWLHFKDSFLSFLVLTWLGKLFSSIGIFSLISLICLQQLSLHFASREVVSGNKWGRIKFCLLRAAAIIPVIKHSVDKISNAFRLLSTWTQSCLAFHYSLLKAIE